MKGQVSIEFLSLMAIVLLASALLMTELKDRTVEFDKGAPFGEAESLARKVSYTFDHAVSDEGIERKLEFSPDLRRNYYITVNNTEVFVEYDSGSTVFPTSYSGKAVEFSSNGSYSISYNGSDINVR